MAIVHASATMLPRLQAEEALHVATVSAVGSGAAGDRASGILRAWQRQAGQRFRGLKPTPADLAAMGIALVPPPPTDGDRG